MKRLNFKPLLLLTIPLALLICNSAFATITITIMNVTSDQRDLYVAFNVDQGGYQGTNPVEYGVPSIWYATTTEDQTSGNFYICSDLTNCGTSTNPSYCKFHYDGSGNTGVQQDGCTNLVAGTQELTRTSYLINVSEPFELSK